MGNKEILLVAESIAHEKGIATKDIIEAMESGIELAARKKYGNLDNIECKIDRKTGQINLFNNLLIIDNDEGLDFNSRKYIFLPDALSINEQAKVGDFLKQHLPPIDLSRVVAKIARGEIVRKVKEAEKEREYTEFKDRVSDIVSAVVKKIGIKNILMEIDGCEAVIHESGLIKHEHFSIGDRMRCYIEDVRRENDGAQIFLSRTHPQFLVKLFESEVSELNEGGIEIKSVSRDPGSRAKVAVHSRRDDIDVVGSMIGVRGSRVNAVSAELRGEKIDIIKWSPNIAEYTANAMIPAKISKVIVDESQGLVEVVVATDDQLSLAIGRGGQNVRLASKLIGYKVDVITQEQESTRRTSEFNKASELFMAALDVEEMIANLLASEGFLDVVSISEASESEIASIEGFDEEIALEIKRRAEEFLQNKSFDC